MALSGLFAFVLTNIYYQIYLKPQNDEKLTEVTEEIQAFFGETNVNADRYFDHIGQLGYQLAVFDEIHEPSFYGGSFREELLSSGIIEGVLNGETYHGIKHDSGQLFITGFFNNELSNSIGVPIEINGAQHGLFIRPNIEQQLGEFREFLAVLVALMVVCSILFVVISTRFIVKPIEQLSDATKRMAAGYFEVDVPIRRKDEIGQLASSFSNMAKELQQLESMRQEFVANVSHEIQSPLTTIQGMTHALSNEGIDDEKRTRYIKQIETESKRLSSLSRQLLLLASLEHGAIQSAPVSIQEQWREVIRSTSFTWREKDLFIETDVPNIWLMEMRTYCIKFG